jgi:hypothetical protein
MKKAEVKEPLSMKWTCKEIWKDIEVGEYIKNERESW